jgi:hypothetical protein
MQLVVERISRVAGVTLKTAAVASTTTPGAHGQVTKNFSATATSWSETKNTGSSKKPLVLGGAVAAIALLGAVGWFATRPPAPSTVVEAEGSNATKPASPPPAPQVSLADKEPVEARPVLEPEAAAPEAAEAPAGTAVASTPAAPSAPAKPAATRVEKKTTQSSTKREPKQPEPAPAPLAREPEKASKPAVKNPLSIELK